jgi:hypothetical protein
MEAKQPVFNCGRRSDWASGGGESGRDSLGGVAG